MAWRSESSLLRGISFVVIIASAFAEKLPNYSLGDFTTPPKIKVQPRTIIAFKIDESIELPCDAFGVPKPLYYWKKNDQIMDPNGLQGRVTQQPSVGTIVINRPLAQDEGVYQCFAKNSYGIAASVRSILIKAVLQGFPEKSVKEYRAQIGQSLHLPCASPKSFPPAYMFWAIASEDTGFRQVILNNRITMDQEGSLYFTNIIKKDQLSPGSKYVCVANNKILRTFKQGEDSKIIVEGSEAVKSIPTQLWNTPSSDWTAVAGREFRLKCIYGGFPTPEVKWKRTNGEMPTRVYFDSFGQELVFKHIAVADAGGYQCRGQNQLGDVPKSFSYNLNVQQAPFWLEEPKDVIAAEDETVSFICKAGGSPRATIEWFINGEPIGAVASNSRRIVKANNITYIRLSKSDAQVVQCNASNAHGYIFGNAYLNVLAEPPSFTEPPARTNKVAENQGITLTCQTFAAPQAKVSWSKDGTPLTGGRYITRPNGDLFILNVVAADAGKYTCTAKNKFGQVSEWGKLQVRQKTTIHTKPQDLKIVAGDEAKFVCTATTDSEETKNLNVEWKKDDDFINYQLVQRVFKNTLDDSLTISGSVVSDTGRYTCVATNGLDTVTAEAYLTVQDRPKPPIMKRVDCTKYKRQKQALIQWDPNGDNYAPILEYLVQYNTTFSPDQWTSMTPTRNDEYDSQPGDLGTEMLVQLSPWANYTFRVIAKNRIGASPPSKHSDMICRTVDDVPDRNPSFVRGEGDQPQNLVIMWSPMPPIEHNGEGFYYEVEWKCSDTANKCNRASYPNKLEGNIKITDRKQEGRYIISGMPTYTKFEIKVRAGNSKGQSRVSPKTIIGYTGEEEPTAVVEGFALDDSFEITSTEARFRWNKIEPNSDNIKGFFVGYRIQYYRKADPSDKRHTDVIVNQPHYFESNSRRKRQVMDKTMSRIVNDLPPYSTVIVTCFVRNKRYLGPPSSPITVTTTEGKPGPVIGFRSHTRNANTLTFLWNKPEEPNGILIGYSLYYQKVNGLDLEYKQLAYKINDPETLTGRLSGLMPDQKYRVYIAARTRVGSGEDTFLDVSTTPAGPPNPPTFSILEIGENYVNISWTPSMTGNPGSVFYSQYRLKGFNPWQNTATETLRNWINVTGLDSGLTYQMRVVARNGQNEEAPSDIQEVTLRGYSASTASVGTAAWFIILLVILAFLIILVIIVCLIKRNKAGKYPVMEKESLREREEQERNQFGDYRDPAHQYFMKSKESINSGLKPVASDTDSMNEYAENDPSKFNEDGSFIGQYGGKKHEGSEYIPSPQDPNAPSALSTFV